jgi:hypothetical protein
MFRLLSTLFAALGKRRYPPPSLRCRKRVRNGPLLVRTDFYNDMTDRQYIQYMQVI